eukprot:g5899.t1
MNLAIIAVLSTLSLAAAATEPSPPPSLTAPQSSVLGLICRKIHAAAGSASSSSRRQQEALVNLLADLVVDDSTNRSDGAVCRYVAEPSHAGTWLKLLDVSVAGGGGGGAEEQAASIQGSAIDILGKILPLCDPVELDAIIGDAVPSSALRLLAKDPADEEAKKKGQSPSSSSEEEALPYGGDVKAATKAKDRAAIKLIMAAKKKKKERERAAQAAAKEDGGDDNDGDEGGGAGGAAAREPRPWTPGTRTVVYLLLMLARSLKLNVRGRGEQNALLTSAHTVDGALAAAAAASTDEVKQDGKDGEEKKALAGEEEEEEEGAEAEKEKKILGATESEELLEMMRALLAGDTAWRGVLRSVLRGAVDSLPLVLVPYSTTDPSAAGMDPHTWTALAALGVMGDDHAELMGRGGGDNKNKHAGANNNNNKNKQPAIKVVLCDNHDDGKTAATIRCEYGARLALCAVCDRIIHLKKAKRDLKRTPIKVKRPPEELAVDYSDGCARARLRWLMVLADAANSKAVVEFKAV